MRRGQLHWTRAIRTRIGCPRRSTGGSDCSDWPPAPTSMRSQSIRRTRSRDLGSRRFMASWGCVISLPGRWPSTRKRPLESALASWRSRELSIAGLDQACMWTSRAKRRRQGITRRLCGRPRPLPGWILPIPGRGATSPSYTLDWVGALLQRVRVDENCPQTDPPSPSSRLLFRVSLATDWTD